MNDEDLREKINKFTEEKYKGNIRKLTPKDILDCVGKESFQYIKSILHDDLKISNLVMIYSFLNDITTPPKCPCGNELKFNLSGIRFAKYCSDICRFNNIEDVIKLRKETNLKKYGTSNYLASVEGKEKIVNTSLEKYGVKNYTQTNTYKDSVIGKSLSVETITKIKNTSKINQYEKLQTKYKNCKPLFSIDVYKGVNGYIKYDWLCLVCNKEFKSSIDNGSYPICEHCRPRGSKHEVICKQYLDSLNIGYSFRNRELPSGKEIDILVKDKNFGIELCGLYYHSTAGPSYGEEDHINKLIECEQNGIKLFTIYDDEMFNPIKRRIVFNKIKNSVGKVSRKIYARKCKIIEVDNQISTKFLNKYHIQGSIGGTYKYGLTYKNRLVALMTFNKGRIATGNKSVEGEWELGRYTTIFNFSIVGGASKLLTHFIKTVSPKLIYSYADRRWSNGNLYDKIGFKFIKNTLPNYWYTKDFKSREHRVKYQKSKLKDFPNYDINLTEEKIMEINKFYKTWDCGSKLYVWENPTLKNI